MTSPQRTIEEEFDFVCKAAGLVKLGISKKPTWLTVDKSEGVELDGTTVRVFNNDAGERNYKDVPGSKLQAIVDAFKVPAPKPEPKKAPPKCPICNKDMILTVIDVVDGGKEVGGVLIEGFVCEDETKHKAAKPAEVVKSKGDEKMKEEKVKNAVSIIRPLTQNQIIEAAASTSKLLVDVIEKAKLYSMIQQKKYVRVEGWETLGALLLCSSEIVKSEEYKNRYRAEAIIKNQDGKVISNGIGICLRSEKNWANRDDFAICSMAQTRAIGKAYRLGFAWIMSLAGYEVCPAEEIDEAKA